MTRSREAFEAWFAKEHHSRLSRNMPDKSYNDPLAYSQWEAWQAAIKHEREAAAKLVESYPCLQIDGEPVKNACSMIAAAIRARGQE